MISELCGYNLNERFPVKVKCIEKFLKEDDESKYVFRCNVVFIYSY